MDEEHFADMTFPSRGVNKVSGFQIQLPETTPVGENVRMFEAMTNRARGGSRSGLSQWIEEEVTGAGLETTIQHIGIVVTNDGDAMLGSFNTGDFLDPSSAGPEFSWPPLKFTRNPQRFVRAGGDGVQPFKNHAPLSPPVPPIPPTEAKRYKIEFNSAAIAGHKGLISFVDLGGLQSWTAPPYNGTPPHPPLTWRIMRYTSVQLDSDDPNESFPTTVAVESSVEIASGDIGIALPNVVLLSGVVVDTGVDGASKRLEACYLEEQSFPGGQYPADITVLDPANNFNGNVPADD